MLKDVRLARGLVVTRCFDVLRWFLQRLLWLPTRLYGGLGTNSSMMAASPEADRAHLDVKPRRMHRSKSTGWLGEEAPGTAASAIIKAGYPLEEHTIVTEDGYVLRMERIPRPGAKDVVFFNHGVFDTSLGWVSNGVTGSQAFAAYDNGFDVWLGNSRSNPPRKHTDAKMRGSRYWHFSINELGMMDVSAQIDFINDLKLEELTRTAWQSSRGKASGRDMLHVPSSIRAVSSEPELRSAFHKPPVNAGPVHAPQMPEKAREAKRAWSGPMQRLDSFDDDAPLARAQCSAAAHVNSKAPESTTTSNHSECSHIERRHEAINAQLCEHNGCQCAKPHLGRQQLRSHAICTSDDEDVTPCPQGTCGSSTTTNPSLAAHDGMAASVPLDLASSPRLLEQAHALADGICSSATTHMLNTYPTPRPSTMPYLAMSTWFGWGSTPSTAQPPQPELALPFSSSTLNGFLSSEDLAGGLEFDAALPAHCWGSHLAHAKSWDSLSLPSASSLASSSDLSSEPSCNAEPFANHVNGQAATSMSFAAAPSDGGGPAQQQSPSVPYRLRAVGHSLGAASLLIYAITRRAAGRPHYLHRLILQAPAGFHRHTPLAIIPFMATLPPLCWILKRLRPGWGGACYVRSPMLRFLTFKLVHAVVALPALRELVLAGLRVLLAGDTSQWDAALRVPHHNVFGMPALSFHCGKHICQWHWTGRFQLYDYGSAAENRAYYGKAVPPNLADSYHLLDMPVDVLAGQSDGVVAPENVLLHCYHMRWAGCHVSYREFECGHMDFTMAAGDDLRHYVLSRLKLD